MKKRIIGSVFCFVFLFMMFDFIGLGYGGADFSATPLPLVERLAQVVTNPYIAPFLLTIGIAGLIIEVFTMGWGIAGFVGISALFLYFGGHLLAGFTGWGAVLLFLFGIILLGVEVFIPGFGLAGIGGLICLIISIVFSAPSWEEGIISLVLALMGTIVLVLLSWKFLTKRRFWDRLILGLKYKKEEGYIPQGKDLSIYVGQQGEALTILRPAGTVLLPDGTKLDVVTDGGFIPRGAKVEIMQAEGIRLIVRSIAE